MTPWTRIVGAAGIAAGVVVAATVGGVTAQRRAVARIRSDVRADGGPAFDALAADRSYSVPADHGAVLHVEEVGPARAPLTVIFAHGWTLRSGAWHFQRLGLAGPGFGRQPERGGFPAARLVFYDQRAHGRSSRGAGNQVSMDLLAADLAAVLAAAAPSGPVVLIGHSMGGMALITLAGRRPRLFADRVVGVGLISTSAHQVPVAALGRALIRLPDPLLRTVSGIATRFPELVEWSRAGAHDAAWLLTRLFGFARRDVPVELVDYLDEMITATPVGVIADFAPMLMRLAAGPALPVLAELPVAIVCGDADRLTPPARSRYMADVLPGARLTVIPDAGHMAILEAPEEVNQALRVLLEDAATRAGIGRTGSGTAAVPARRPAR